METMADVRAAHAERGGHWFEPGAMRFFDSRVHSKLYGGRWFISSERFDYQSPRLYSIREARDDGSIDTVGEFQAYLTIKDARDAARTLARGETVAPSWGE